MAKQSMINREAKRQRLVNKYAAKRAELKKAAINLDLSPEEREEARLKLQKLPRNSSSVRLQNRCRRTGRNPYRKRSSGPKWRVCNQTLPSPENRQTSPSRNR